MPMRRMLWKTMQAPQRSGSAYTEIGNKNVWELWLAKLKSIFYEEGGHWSSLLGSHRLSGVRKSPQVFGYVPPARNWGPEVPRLLVREY